MAKRVLKLVVRVMGLEENETVYSTTLWCTKYILLPYLETLAKTELFKVSTLNKASHQGLAHTCDCRHWNLLPPCYCALHQPEPLHSYVGWCSIEQIYQFLVLIHNTGLSRICNSILRYVRYGPSLGSE